MIRYLTQADGIRPYQLEGFFVGWPRKPSSKTLLRLLRRSDFVVLALDRESRKVVGFVTALSDGVLSAYIPFLEVLPAFQGRGIGRELMRRIMSRLRGFYMVDLTCDERLQPFYEPLGLMPSTGMMRRNYSFQAGRP